MCTGQMRASPKFNKANNILNYGIEKTKHLAKTPLKYLQYHVLHCHAKNKKNNFILLFPCFSVHIFKETHAHWYNQSSLSGLDFNQLLKPTSKEEEAFPKQLHI